MADRRRGLGRGLGALIPTEPSGGVGVSRPRDVFFRDEERSSGQYQREEPEAAAPPPAPAGDPGARAAAIAGHGPDGSDEGHAEERGGAPGPGLAPVPGATFARLLLDSIRANPHQPRTVFDEDELSELSHSIREIGVLQPIVVRPVADAEAGVSYEIVMGERRWRASRAAGEDAVPAIITRTPDDDMLRNALLENLHRSQLNPLEEAAAYQQLLQDFGCTHEELAAKIGRSRPQITNIIRLLKLPPLVARRVAAGVLSAGHARALLGLPDHAAMERLAQRIVAEGLSVRSAEEIVALGGEAPQPDRARRRTAARVPELDDLAARLADCLDTSVSIAMGRHKGKMTVEFASVDDLDRILAAIAEQGPALRSAG